MNDELFKCNMCYCVAQSFDSFKQHVVRCHSHDANFSVTCCIGACGYSTKNWNTYKVHVTRCHSALLRSETDKHLPEETCEVLSPYMQSGYCPLPQCSEIEFTNANYCLALEAKHNTSKGAIDDILQSTDMLIKQHMDHYRSIISSKLRQDGIDPSIVNISFDTGLDVLSSAGKRDRFYESKLGLVQPVEIVLGDHKVLRNGVFTDVAAKGYFLPFDVSLSSLLSMPDVWDCVSHSHQSNDTFMHDIGDGSFVKNSSFFSNNPKALQIILNTDDLEIVNPLGSHVKKHKITVFYYMLANIPPEHRSQLHCLQLLAIAKTSDLRRHCAEGKLLENFISVVNKLSSCGLHLAIGGRYEIVKGALVGVVADTLAAHWLGKFKEGVAFAAKGCRHCECETGDMRCVFVSSQCQLRSDSTHAERCEDLKSLSKKAFTYWSKMWGVNGSSCLLQLDFFPLTSGLLQDPMHILLEGVVPHELSYLLFQLLCCSADIKFNLSSFNGNLSGFPYSYLHAKAKPEQLEKAAKSNTVSVKQTASSMLTLCHVLPLLLGKCVPLGNPYWDNWLRLLRIVLISTSPDAHVETAGLLRVLIAEYLCEFQRLYPNAPFIPKMHYMIHLPDQMLQYGPLRHIWCMRFEGKNGFFKNKKWRNFRNVPYSLARYHQLHLLHRQTNGLGSVNENFLYAGDVVGQGAEFLFADRFQEFADTFSAYCGYPVDRGYLAKSVVVHGLEYRSGCCAIVLHYEHDDTPAFGIIRHLIVIQHDKYFIIEHTKSVCDAHTLYYFITATESYSVKRFSALQYKWPLSIYNYDGHFAVLNVCSHTCPLL